ncbi:MAG: 5-formyltetrahydrofolate cyclo-ligase [Arenicellales bacterium]
MNVNSDDLPSELGNKTRLRKSLRAARRMLTPEDQSKAAEDLLTRLLEVDLFTQSNRIALYLAHDGEIDPSRVIHWCQINFRHSYLPIVKQERGRNWLMFGEVEPNSQFQKNKFGIQEPVIDQSALLDARELDLVLLPLVGFDRRGNRIGMGGGFYDTTFEFLRQSANRTPELIGVAHEIQKITSVNAESWDVPLTMVVTDQAVYRLMP